MGIPVNEKCMLIRVGGHAYLDNVVGVVEIWKVAANREGEKGRGREYGTVISIYLFVIEVKNVSARVVLLSYRRCAQVKLQISGRSCLESYSGRFQLTKTSQEPQMEPRM